MRLSDCREFKLPKDSHPSGLSSETLPSNLTTGPQYHIKWLEWIFDGYSMTEWMMIFRKSQSSPRQCRFLHNFLIIFFICSSFGCKTWLWLILDIANWEGKGGRGEKMKNIGEIIEYYHEAKWLQKVQAASGFTSATLPSKSTSDNHWATGSHWFVQKEHS